MEFNEIKGFGEKRIIALKSAGIASPADLVSYFPSRYIDTTSLADLRAKKEGDRVVILACTHDKPKVAYIKKGLNLVKVKFVYDNCTVWCSWFRQPYMAKNIVPEQYYYIEGRLKKFKNTYEIVSPQLIKFTGQEPSVIPVYKPIGKVSGKLIEGAIRTALSKVKLKSYIPEKIMQKYSLNSVDTAFRNIHFPTKMSEVFSARKVLALEKMSYMFTAYSLIKKSNNAGKIYRYEDRKAEINKAVSSLPFSLTGSQKECVNKIVSVMLSSEKLNALIEGDVGSGKTIIAFLVMYFCSLSNFQSAIMAPTEILAYQHYKKALEFFTPLGVRCGYLSSSLSKKERDEVLLGLSSGKIRCVFGTHALISDDVVYDKLSLVIVDEQHRFGVEQRARLERKSLGADSIVMSATPIPRTLALTLYGDLTQITLSEVPPRKAKITTRFVPSSKESDMWKYLEKTDGQAFVVAPRIEGDDEDDNSAENIYEKYKQVFGDKIALLHGRMKESVKLQTMQAFSEGKIKVLVATTVVEVGIDVPSATSMVIYDADRFGLSQLHQLRGRVGRGDKDAYCFVLSDGENDETKERIDKFISCSNGFDLAEYDFVSRGAGDFLGYSQHGDGEFSADKETILLAKQISNDMLCDESAVSMVKQTITGKKYEFFSGITLN